jgi:hypothetical protein
MLGHPATKVFEDKTAKVFGADMPPELERKRPDLMFETSAKINGKQRNIIQLIEVTTPWSWDGEKGNNLRTAYQKKSTKYGP